MSLSNPLDILLTHDRWATEQLLNACKPLTDEQLDRPFEIGRGSLRSTLVHLVDVVRGWDHALNMRPDDDALDAHASVGTILERFAQIADSFEKTCHTGTTADRLNPSRGPRSILSTRGVFATHILTHGTHHRAQALNMLRHLGVTPLPKSSVMEWSIATGESTLTMKS